MADGDRHDNEDSSLKRSVALKLTADLRCVSIRADVTFLACLADVFFDRHFKFLQQMDTWSGSYGYQSHRMPVRSYVMHRDLKAIMESIGSRGEIPEMEPWYDVLEKLPEAEQKDGDGSHLPSQPRWVEVASEYLQDAYDLLEKHTARWRGKLAWAALGDEPAIAREVARVGAAAPSVS